MEKSLESLRHSQAKCVELEKMNKKLHSQTHTDRREIIRMREEVEVLKVKASRVDKLQVELNTQRERVEEAGRNAVKLKVRSVVRSFGRPSVYSRTVPLVDSFFRLPYVIIDSGA